MANTKKPENSEEEYTGILGNYQEQKETVPVETASAPKKINPFKIAGAAVLTAVLIGGMGCMKNADTVPTEDSSQSEISDSSGDSSSSSADISSLPENSTAAVYSQNFDISPALMNCFYQDYLQQYASALSYYGIDTETMSLKEEKLPEDAGEDMTWFEFIMTQAKNTTSNLLIFQEAANADGYTLTEEDKQTVEEQLASIDLSTYGGGVTEDDARTMLEMEILASSYVNHLMEEMQLTEEELEAYYQDNKLNFDTCSLMGFNIYYQTEDETTDSESEAESESEDETLMSQEQAEELAEKLAQASSPEDFEAQVKEILINYEDYEEEELEDLSGSIRADGFSYTEGFDVAEWAFGGTAKAGQSHLTENEGYYSVYYLISEPARDDTATVNVRHILFLTENYIEADDEATDEELEQAEQKALETCETYAYNLLKEFETGEESEERFAELANQYSEDPGSNTNGGLYEGVTPGQMVAPFNDWCFDASRKVGDTDVVETSYGFHVMYFSGKGEPLWKSTASSSLKSEQMDKWFTEQKEIYAVASNEDVINSIEG